MKTIFNSLPWDDDSSQQLDLTESTWELNSHISPAVNLVRHVSTKYLSTVPHCFHYLFYHYLLLDDISHTALNTATRMYVLYENTNSPDSKYNYYFGICDKIIEVQYDVQSGKIVSYQIADVFNYFFKLRNNLKMSGYHKPSIAKIYPKFLTELASVLDYGDIKHGKRTWTTQKDTNKIMSAIGRHYLKLNSGEYYDSESGYSHIAHIAANLMIFQYQLLEGVAELSEVNFYGGKYE